MRRDASTIGFCVRFLHRALPRPRAGSDKLTTAGPGLALNSTCGNGHTSVEWLEATPLGDSTVTTQDDSCAVTLACGVSAARFTAPRYRNSLAFHFPFIILRRSCHVFRPRCLSVFSIQNLLQEIRPRQFSQNFAIISIRVLVISTIIILIRANSIPLNATT